MVLGSRPSGKPLGSWLRLPMGSLLSGETLGSWLKHPEHSQPAQGAVAVSPGTGGGADPCAAAGLLRPRDHGTPVANASKRASAKRMRSSSCAVQAVVAWASCSMRSLKSSICVRRGGGVGANSCAAVCDGLGDAEPGTAVPIVHGELGLGLLEGSAEHGHLTVDARDLALELALHG